MYCLSSWTCLRIDRNVNSKVELSLYVGRVIELIGGLAQVSVLFGSTSNLVSVLHTGSSSSTTLDSLIMWVFNGWFVGYDVTVNWMFHRIDLVSKIFSDALLTWMLGCGVSLLSPLLTQCIEYMSAAYLVSYWSLLDDNNLTPLLLRSPVVWSHVFVIDEMFYIVRFFLKGWLKWSEFTSTLSYSVLGRFFILVDSPLFTVLLFKLVDYMRKSISVVLIGLGSVCTVWVSNLLFTCFSYELFTLNVWGFLLIQSHIRSLNFQKRCLWFTID